MDPDFQEMIDACRKSGQASDENPLIDKCYGYALPIDIMEWITKWVSEGKYDLIAKISNSNVDMDRYLYFANYMYSFCVSFSGPQKGISELLASMILAYLRGRLDKYSKTDLPSVAIATYGLKRHGLYLPDASSSFLEMISKFSPTVRFFLADGTDGGYNLRIIGSNRDVSFDQLIGAGILKKRGIFSYSNNKVSKEDIIDPLKKIDVVPSKGTTMDGLIEIADKHEAWDSILEKTQQNAHINNVCDAYKEDVISYERRFLEAQRYLLESVYGEP